MALFMTVKQEMQLWFIDYTKAFDSAWHEDLLDLYGRKVAFRIIKQINKTTQVQNKTKKMNGERKDQSRSM